MIYDPSRYIARVSIDGKIRSIQVLGEDMSGEMKVQMYGADMPCVIQNEREFESSKHMRPPKVVDTSDLVLSPMPGTLIAFSVEEGDKVELGQELCVVEAMKMQNVIKAEKDGVVEEVNVKAGDSVAVDELLI